MNIQFIEIKGQGAGIKLRPDQAAGDDRFDLGRKNKFAPLAPGIIKRFFAEAVADTEQQSPFIIPQGKSEHPGQLIEESDTSAAVKR